MTFRIGFGKTQHAYSLLSWSFKKQPRGARCGGVILDPKGKLETKFAWGMGVNTNNQAKALAIY